MSERTRSKRTAGILLLTAGFWLITERDASAYLDPGSGSMILQMALGAIAAFFFTIKIYWKKLTGFFAKKKNDPDSPRNDPGKNFKP